MSGRSSRNSKYFLRKVVYKNGGRESIPPQNEGNKLKNRDFQMHAKFFPFNRLPRFLKCNLTILLLVFMPIFIENRQWEHTFAIPSKMAKIEIVITLYRGLVSATAKIDFNAVGT